MKLLGADKLAKALRNNAAARTPVRRWLELVGAAEWKAPSDVKSVFASASFLANNRVVFNIGGNNYRLIVIAVYADDALEFRWFGTHAEYDEIDAQTV